MALFPISPRASTSTRPSTDAEPAKETITVIAPQEEAAELQQGASSVLPRRSARRPANTSEETTVKRVVKIIQKRPSLRRKWTPESILTDPKSPLAKANLRTLLSNPLAWEALDAKDREEILALFSDKSHITETAGDGRRPNFASLMNDDSFRYDCAAYTENMSQGRHEQEWLESAWSAHERRKLGDFDEYLLNKFEDEWTVELPAELKEQRRRSRPAPQEEAGVGGFGDAVERKLEEKMEGIKSAIKTTLGGRE